MLSSASLATSLATTFVALLMASPSHALDGAQNPTYQGCYSSDQGLTYNDTDIYQSRGACQLVCFPLGKAVMAMTGGNECYCGDEMPPLSTKVDDSKCSAPCVGWTPDNCGSPSGSTPVYYAVWNAGLKSVVTNAPASSASSGASSTSSSAAVVTVSGGQTIVVTASNAPGSGSGSGPSTAGIAAGVVVGVIAIAAIAGGAWFFIRARRRREVEEEYQRQAAVNAFINGGKPGSSAGSSPDSRLDPVIMTQRRMSDGSIADNQDYSRRILKVTNA